MVRQFVGPRGDPDRYELVELLSTDASGNEHWYASRWQHGAHVPYRVGIARHLDHADHERLDVVGVGPDLAPPDGHRDWALAESFTGPLPHAWEAADPAPITWYQVWAGADVLASPPPTVIAPAAPAPARSPRWPAIDRRKVLAGFGVAAALSVVVLAVAVGSGSSGGSESDTATTKVATPVTVTALPAPTTVPTTVAPTTTRQVVTGPSIGVDPEGDSFGVDLVRASASTDGQALVLEVHLTPQTFGDDTIVSVAIDTDQDPRTGRIGIDATCGYHADHLGSDYNVSARGGVGYGQIVKHDDRCSGITFSSAQPIVEQLEDGLRIIVPLADLGGDDGIVNYAVMCSRFIEPGSSYGIEDILPNPEEIPPTSVRS